MMNILIARLDKQLADCKKFANDYSTRHTYFDQAFGMVLMFQALYPNSTEKVGMLWMETYYPQFNKILWGEELGD